MPDTYVLIVEDELEIAELIRFHLERERFQTRFVASGTMALDAIAEEPPDLVLLDLMLPDLDGLEVCRRLKYQPETRDVPVIIVSAKGEESDIVTGIELGADDYITKPFSPKVLMARVKNVLRRHEQREPVPVLNQPIDDRIRLAGGSVMIDGNRHTVIADGQSLHLTVTEFGILRFLATRPGFVRTRDQIIAAVHGGHTVLSRRTVDVHVTALRRKLGDFGRLIETVRGVGYRLSENIDPNGGQGD